MCFLFSLYVICFGVSYADDVAGITVSPTSGLTCTEASGEVEFSIVLTSEPVSTVTVGVSSNDLTEGNLGSVTALTFVAGSWSSAQTVTVTGVDDDVMDGDIAFTTVVSAATSDDGNYDTLDGNDVSLSTIDGK